MNTRRLSVFVTLALCAIAAPAHAQQARSFVSGLGSDTNAPNCVRTAPCRTFQVAHDNTLANGEITVLDPGSYGSVMITKDISIVNDGVGEAGALVSGGATAVTVNAAGAAVTLRGLTIKGIGFGGGNGIVFDAGTALNVENCTIRNLDTLGTGIIFQPNAAAALTVTNTTISDNTSNGILVLPSGTAAVTGVLDHVGLYNNGFAGLNLAGAVATGGTIEVTVVDSIASNNGTPGSGAGFLSQAPASTAITRIFLLRSVADTNPSNGILSNGPNAVVAVNESAVWRNASGWLAMGGATIFTFGNNAVFGNTANQGPQTSQTLQ